MKARRLGPGLLGVACAALAGLAWLGIAPSSAASPPTTPTTAAPTTQVTVPGATGPAAQVAGANVSTTQVTVPGAAGSFAPVPPPAQPTLSSPVPVALSAPAGSGADSLLRPPSIGHGNPATFAERYGSSFYSLTQAAGTGGTGGNTTDGALGAVSDAMWSMVMLLVGFATTVVQWAFRLDLASVIAPTVRQITGTLARIVFDPWVATVVVLGGAWLVWWGLVRRRMSVAGEGALWMVVALAAAVAFLAQPTSLLTGADRATSAIGTSALAALAPLAPAQASVDGSRTGSNAYAKGPASDAELRRAGNTLWETYVYEPWLVAEFGSISAGKSAGPAWLALQTHGGTVAAEQADLAGSATSGKTAVGGGNALSKAAAPNPVASTAPPNPGASAAAPNPGAKATATAQAWFAGSYTSGRFGVVLVAFIAAVALCVLLCALALAVLLAQVALVLLVALAPVFLLAGVHPGYGRRVALRWVELAMAAVVKRVVYSLALAAVLVITGNLISLMSAAGVGWAITALLPTLALTALVLFRRRVSQALLGAGARPGRHTGGPLPQSFSGTVTTTHGGIPRRVATHPVTRHPAPRDGRPPWWGATRHPVRPSSPIPRSDVDRSPRSDLWSPVPAQPKLDDVRQEDDEPAPVA